MRVLSAAAGAHPIEERTGTPREAMKLDHRWLCGALTALLLTLCACHAATPPSAPVEETAETPVVAQEAAPDTSAEETMRPQPTDFHRHFMRINNGFFYPNALLTRAECAQILYNLTAEDMALPPPTDAECPYGDVSPERWYYGAVCAAAPYFPEEQWLFSPDEPICVQDFLEAVSLALESPEALQSACDGLLSDAEDSGDEFLTRTQVAVLLCRALGREPDAETIHAAEYTLLLDVSEDDEYYADIIEAILPHDYAAQDGAELWADGSLDQLMRAPGVYLSGGVGYVVDETGEAVRGSGLLDFDGERYFRYRADGRIYADGALHRCGDEVIFTQADGTLLRSGAVGEYTFDADGFYSCGSETVDEEVREFIASCTSPGMTRSEKLRACYSTVRALRYLGRNAAYGAEVQTIPHDRLLEFADKIFTTGKGDCYNFTAAFCLLARQLGYRAEAIVGECAYSWNWNGIAHGWVEVQLDGETRIFDPQIENYNLRVGLDNGIYSAFGVTYENAPARYWKH